MNVQVIASATETEITTDIVSDLLPPEQFFRFNPRMFDMPIDEVRKERLDWLKTLADEYFEVGGGGTVYGWKRVLLLPTLFMPL